MDSDGAWIQTTQNNTGEKNKNPDISDVDVSLKYKVEVAQKFKGTDKEIIEATKRAIFDMICSYAKRYNYNYKYLSDDPTLIIFDVKEISKNVWQVYFQVKPLSNEVNGTYQYATVTKQENGNYKGNVEIIYN